MDHTDWEDHKAEIERLYIRQDRSLKEVMKILRTRNFHKSELGRDSEVYVDGIRYPPKKVQRGIRQGFISAADMYSVPSPQTPEGILVCSPAQTTALQWPHKLPWLQFLQWMNGQENRIPFPTSSAILPVNYHGQVVDAHAMLQAFQLFLPHWDLQKGPNMDEASKVVGILQILMPEEQDEGHRMTSDVLFSPSSSMGLQERFKLLFYFLSNNFSLHSRDGLQPSGFSERDIAKEDDLVLHVLRISGLNTLHNMRHLFAMPGLTPRAIAENLFGSAVRCSDLGTITVMLDAGMDPQTPVMTKDYIEEPAMTPLEYVCDIKPSIRIAQLLLSHNANVNAYRYSPCLLSALLRQHSDLIDLLISHGADIDICLEELKSTACRGAMHSNGIIHPLKPFLDRFLDVDWVEMLITRDADVNSLHEVRFEEDSFHTTALGLAAKSGNMDILRMLLTANVASDLQITANPNIIQPLTLAVDRGHVDATMLLINCGGDINAADYCSGSRKTLFDRALQKGTFEICEYLLHMGAAVGEHTLQLFYGKRLCKLVLDNDVDRILQLPLKQINLNYEVICRTFSGRGCKYGTIHLTALGIAIEMGSIQILEILLKAGATNIGSPLERIGGVGTAQCLNHVGLLPRVLKSSGQNLLVAAIDIDDDTLVEYLLPHLTTEKLSQRRTEIQSWQRKTPLEAAIRKGRLGTMEALLTCGARIADAELTAAVEGYLQYGDEETFTHIVSLRSPLRCKAPTALAEALKAEKHVLVDILLCSGLDLTGSEYSRVLARAAMVDDDGLFQRILVTAQWSKEVLGSAFTASIQHGKRARMQYLYDAGADLNQPYEVDDGPWFPLQIAAKNKDISLTKTLIGYGCHPDQSNKAAEDGNIEIVNLLLGAGADPDGVPIHSERVEDGGTTALQSAVRRGHMELVERLLDAGADVNSEPYPNRGATALQFAAIQGFIGIARRLLELCADVNAGRAARFGRTALEGAAEHGRLDMLHFLLANGALIDGRGRRQYIRAVKLAEWNGNSTIATFLRSHGQWTAVDTPRADMERNDLDDESEPDYENDLAWDYSTDEFD
ncbi:ankyrin repeat-containing domain protein [Aspergillus floccosus]